ncbi:MAG: ABC transporter permease, partial [Armatimonadota bacterium]
MAATVRGHLARFVLLLAAMVLVNFLLPRLLPGSPLSSGAGESTVAFLPARTLSEIRQAYGLDRPLAEQFVIYLTGLSRGDLGRSLATHRRVVEMVGERLPWTLLLVGCAVLLSAIVGAALGTAAAWRPGGLSARLAGAMVIGLGALPEFLVAMGLIVVLGVGLRLFPIGGASTPFLAASGPGGWLTAAWDLLWHAALPGATLVIGLVPAFFLLSRNALAGVLGEPFLLTARGK